MLFKSILVFVTASPLNGPNLWTAHTNNPFKCLRDTLVTNTTSGLITTCGDLVATHARLPQPKHECYTWFGMVSDLRIDSLHQTVTPGMNPSEYELLHSVRVHCRPCCAGVFPWTVKTDM